MLNLKGVSKDVWIRLAIYIVLIANQILEKTGHPVINISDAEVEDFVNFCVDIYTVYMTYIMVWKNNSFTREAQMADEYLQELREDDFGDT